MNRRGLQFVHDKSRPLHVYDMAQATEVIAKAIADLIERGGNLADEQVRTAQARHFAWLIGFDTLVADRKALHAVVDLIVPDEG